MEIRRATIEDFEALKEIKLLSKKEELKYSDTINPIGDNEANYFKYLKKDLTYINRGIFIAIENKKIIGMVLAQYFNPLPISKYSRKGYISNLYVLKGYRGTGIGNKLIVPVRVQGNAEGILEIILLPVKIVEVFFFKISLGKGVQYGDFMDLG